MEKILIFDQNRGLCKNSNCLHFFKKNFYMLRKAFFSI